MPHVFLSFQSLRKSESIAQSIESQKESRTIQKCLQMQSALLLNQRESQHSAPTILEKVTSLAHFTILPTCLASPKQNKCSQTRGKGPASKINSKSFRENSFTICTNKQGTSQYLTQIQSLH
ncbi:hypothetical protein FGO68_gene151 [Halteria grandinella]|uniref:Uncharacterized protein n=1 Tax=Halteria grandinella TaxID=5974 RepID=A0A8J8T6L2_HALGN|nr:hypothetical protein FGO68_gene151 [Halteria grandinella]